MLFESYIDSSLSLRDSIGVINTWNAPRDLHFSLVVHSKPVCVSVSDRTGAKIKEGMRQRKLGIGASSTNAYIELTQVAIQS